MAPERVERKLAAILAADVAGYSRLMGSDEEGTLSRFKAHRRELIDPKISEHRGRVVKTTGDGILIEFLSVVDALRCAIDVQRGMAERNKDVPEGSHIEFRVGINVGDIIIDGDDIHGDGVNVAARLEGIAEPGGICISESSYQQVRDKIDIRFEDMGDQQLKNIVRPVRAYRVLHNGAQAAEKATLALPDKPSIAVLPFRNMSGDPEQEYFADGIVEEIITALSRFRQLFVIARNSSFIYKGRAVDVKQVGRELGVRYVLEGSVRKAANRLRITGQLIDASTGVHLWADRFDGSLEDVFDLQDQVTASVVGAIAPALEKAEIERSKRKPTESLDAYDWYLRAADAWISLLSSWTVEDLRETRRLLEKSLSNDPRYARAYALLSSTYRIAWLNRLDADHLRPATLDRAIALAQRAIELDPNLPEAYAELGYLLIRKREYESAIAACERAMALNPNFADYRLAAVFLYAGELPRAIETARAHMRRDPFHPALAPQWLGFVHYLLKEYRDAQRWLGESTKRQPNQPAGHVLLAATYAQLGQLEEARSEVAKVLQINPRYAIAGTLRQIYVFRRADDIEHLVDGVRKAGLPE